MKPFVMGLRKLGPSQSNIEEARGVIHRNIWKILGITITQVINNKITNESVRTRFFDITMIRNQIAQQ